MIERIRYEDIEVDLDRSETRRLYLAIPKGATERCSCVMCQYFADHRAELYPADFRAFLECMEIDWMKEDECWSVAGDGGTTALWVGGFDLAGSVISGGHADSPDLAKPSFQFYARNGASYPWGERRAQELALQTVASVGFQLVRTVTLEAIIAMGYRLDRGGDDPAAPPQAPSTAY